MASHVAEQLRTRGAGADVGRLRLSVALCTYNGTAFLAEQLDSIATQLRKPDELVVSDDASTDGTVSVVEQFATRAPFPVRLLRNQCNVGYAKNFERAIRACTGDVVVLCDQDDVWMAEKLARLETVFQWEPAVGLVFSDADVVGADLDPLGCRLWEAAEFSPRRQRQINNGAAFRALLSGNIVTGATLAFRSRFRDVVLPIGEGAHHDAWIALLVAAVAEVRSISEPLILYRQHGSNEIGIRKFTAWQRLRRASRRRVEDLRRLQLQHLAALQRLKDTPGVPVQQLDLIRQALVHLEARVCLPASRPQRLFPILREVVSGRYRRWGKGVASALRDLIA